ncbi:MAG: sulfatase-like hydrolase/transferase [Terracidiphilus sp.]
MKMRNVLEGVGAALLLFPYYLPFFHPQNHDLYYHGLPVTNLIGGLLVDLLGCSILVTGFLVALPHLPSTPRKVVEALFPGLMLWSIVEFAIQGIRLQHPIEYWEIKWERSALPILLVSGVLAYFIPRAAQPLVRAIRFALASLAFSALWIVPQLIYLALLSTPVHGAAVAHLTAPANNGSRRIIWILFDELSYDQTFEHPAAGIELPNFDRLRAASISFSNLKPIGYETSRIIPSLFTGASFEEFRSTIDGRLSYKDESQRRWTAYDANASLFGVAQQNGWNTGADGWFIPYCGILGSAVNVCYRDSGILLPMEEFGASEKMSVLANAAIVPNQFLAALTQKKKSLANQHIETYETVMAHTQVLIDDQQIRFVFLHLPVPHPPGIFDRQRHALRPGGDYLDNLVLADDTLGTLMREIDATASASQTTVVVTSDHSWRIRLWKSAGDWSAEQERVSGGKFDDRPVLLVHFPRQDSGQDVHAALSEMIEHDMIADMLRGQINNQEDLASYLSQHSR